MIWPFCYTLWVGCNIKEIFFQKRSFFVSFDISTMCNGHIKSKVRKGGPLGHAWKSNFRNLLFFPWNYFTFWSKSFILSKSMSKFEFVLQAEAKAFKTRSKTTLTKSPLFNYKPFRARLRRARNGNIPYIWTKFLFDEWKFFWAFENFQIAPKNRIGSISLT